MTSWFFQQWLGFEPALQPEVAAAGTLTAEVGHTGATEMQGDTANRAWRSCGRHVRGQRSRDCGMETLEETVQRESVRNGCNLQPATGPHAGCSVTVPARKELDMR